MKKENMERLSPEQYRELKRRIADLDDPIRYAIFSDIGGFGKYRLWLDVSIDCFGTTIDQATLFKREKVAISVAKEYSKKRKSPLRIAKRLWKLLCYSQLPVQEVIQKEISSPSPKMI